MGMEDDLIKRMAARKLHGVDDQEKARAMAEAGISFRADAKKSKKLGEGEARVKLFTKAAESREDDQGEVYEYQKQLKTLSDRELRLMSYALSQERKEREDNPKAA